MVHKCNYCKQAKLCRKNKLYSDGAGVGYPSIFLATEWICKDCDRYFFHKEKEEERQSKIDEKERLKDFIKRRDEALKELKFAKGGLDE